MPWTSRTQTQFHLFCSGFVVILTDPELKSDGPDLNRSSDTVIAENTMGIVELWTLYALAVSFTFLRTYARITAVGLSELQVDDYLVWIAIVSSNICFGSYISFC